MTDHSEAFISIQELDNIDMEDFKGMSLSEIQSKLKEKAEKASHGQLVYLTQKTLDFPFDELVTDYVNKKMQTITMMKKAVDNFNIDDE